MELPKHKCPRTEKKHCKICGPYLGLIDFARPGRRPTKKEWDEACAKMQLEHDNTRQKHFDSLQVIYD